MIWRLPRHRNTAGQPEWKGAHCACLPGILRPTVTIEVSRQPSFDAFQTRRTQLRGVSATRSTMDPPPFGHTALWPLELNRLEAEALDAQRSAERLAEEHAAAAAGLQARLERKARGAPPRESGQLAAAARHGARRQAPGTSAYPASGTRSSLPRTLLAALAASVRLLRAGMGPVSRFSATRTWQSRTYHRPAATLRAGSNTQPGCR